MRRTVRVPAGADLVIDDEALDGYRERLEAAGPRPAVRVAYAAAHVVMRAEYARQVDRLLTPDPEQLVITLEYEQAVVAGPPFSVADTEVRSYWSRLQRIAAADDIDNAPPKFIEAGLSEMTEVVWRSG